MEWKGGREMIALPISGWNFSLYLWIQNEAWIGSFSKSDFSHIKENSEEKVIFGEWIFIIDSQFQDVLEMRDFQ